MDRIQRRNSAAPLAGLSTVIAGVLLSVSAQATSVNCSQIWQRSGSGWYENNPTYTDPRNDDADWVFSTPAAEGMDVALLDEGVSAVRTSALRSVLVIRHGKLVYERYYGGANKNTSQNIHSASKSLLRMLVGIAVQQGLITNIDVKVSSILPEYFTNAPTSKKNITVRHLLEMSAGLNWDEDTTEGQIASSYTNWVQGVLARPHQYTPAGSRYEYNTGLTHVLSGVLQRASGMNTCEFAHTYLLNSMNVTAEHWGKDPSGVYSGGYNVYMTAREMAKLGLLWRNNGNWNGSQLVPATVIGEATQPKWLDDPYYYGQLFWLDTIAGYETYQAWGHGGQWIYVIPELDVVFVTSHNTLGDTDNPIDREAFIEDYLIPSIDDGGQCLAPRRRVTNTIASR